MIKLIIFDLDGVLIETKELHYISLNSALKEHSPDHIISLEEHLSLYDGLPTTKKLQMLTCRNGLDADLHDIINKTKQKHTMRLISEMVKPSQHFIDILADLKDKGYKIYLASNAIRRTIVSILHRMDIIEYFDFIYSNEDVSHAKPHPEIYMKCMIHANVCPQETLIIEDSHAGRKGALRSGGYLLPVDYPSDVTLDRILNKIKNIQGTDMKEKWKAKDTVVLIPMAGAGSRFAQAGYTFPKPLVEVNGKPMIQVVVENLCIDAEFVFIVQKEHREKYNLDYLLNLIAPDCKIVEVDGITEGAACTTLLAKEYIDNDKHLVTANSDQFIEFDSHDFFYTCIAKSCDGAIMTFKATHPKWSFAKCDEFDNVIEVAEKKPISDNATVGVYYWNKGSDYVKYAEQMIEKNVRVNNEFYVCPVYNEAIQDGKRISKYEVERMWGLGTPEDLVYFLENNK